VNQGFKGWTIWK